MPRPPHGDSGVPVAATAPSSAGQRGIEPANGGRCVRGCRAGRTSWSASLPQTWLPRGLRRVHPALSFFHTRASGCAQRLGQLIDLGLQLLLPRRRASPASDQPDLAGLDEVGLPPVDRLLADLLLACGPEAETSPASTANTNTNLLLRRDHRRTPHPAPPRLRRRSCTHHRPARKFDAGQRRLPQLDQPNSRADSACRPGWVACRCRRLGWF